MKVINKDATMTALRAKLRECQEQGQREEEIITQCVLTIIGSMPEIDVSDGVACEKCFFYDADKHRCTHKNGLGGRIRKGMYCSYGSFHADDTDEEEDEDEFGEFDD